MGGLGSSNIIALIALLILPLIFAITIHEAAHGWVAKQLGDKTAFLLGRVSLNPIRHIDWFGTIILPMLMIVISLVTFGMPFVFGWAKPVPVNWQNLHHPRRDKALVALAGPVSNIIMAVLWALIARVAITYINDTTSFAYEVARYFYLAGRFGVMINLVLGFLNLIPIPPLDGSRVVAAILSPRLAYQYEKIEPYGIWILLALIFLGGLRWVLYPVVTWAMNLIFSLVGLS